MKDFSVIIPAYNVEKYIKKCVDSVLNQTYKNYEIIIVNDGSTDKTFEIIKTNYTQHNIKIINQANGGLSCARNVGVQNSCGKYLIFLDSDDWWEDDLLENLKKKIVEDNYDIVGFKLQKRYDDANKLEIVNIPAFNATTGKKAIKKLIESHQTFETAVTYAYSYEFWKKYNFEFKVGKYHEDFGLIPYIISCAEKIVILDYIGYNYLKRNDSITSIEDYSKELKKALDTLEHINYLKEGFKKIKFDNYTKELVANYLVNAIITKTLKLKKMDQSIIYKNLRKIKVYQLFNNGTLKSFIKYILIKIHPYYYRCFL